MSNNFFYLYKIMKYRQNVAVKVKNVWLIQNKFIINYHILLGKYVFWLGYIIPMHTTKRVWYQINLNQGKKVF